jgi:predicted dehydrogenase
MLFTRREFIADIKEVEMGMLKTAVIGAGTMGVLYARAFHESGRAELSAIVDLDRERAADLAAQYGCTNVYEDTASMLAELDIEAAAVALPDYAHRDTVVTLLAAGVHVLCEKPLAVTLEDCADIVGAAGGEPMLMVNYGNRHRAEARALRELVRSGALGEIQTVVMKGNEKLAKTRQLAWRDRTDPTWFLISHLVDFVSWITGQDFTDVYGLQSVAPLQAGGDALLPAITGHSYLGTLGNGAVVNLTASWILPSGAPAAGDMTIELIGTDGSAAIDFMERPVIFHGERAEHLAWDFAADYSGKAKGWWFTSCNYFLDCVASGVQPEPDARAGAETSLVLMAMHESLASGGRVSVDAQRQKLDELLASGSVAAEGASR